MYVYCMSDVAVWLQLKSPMQIMMAMDTNQRTELEAMIHDLEEENKWVMEASSYIDDMELEKSEL